MGERINNMDLWKEHNIIDFEVHCVKCDYLLKSYGDSWVWCNNCDLIYKMAVHKARIKKFVNKNNVPTTRVGVGGKV